MITLLDGPMGATTLLVRRAPLYLRVTGSPDGQIDCLDQVDDEADPHEVIFVYRRVGLANTIHLDLARGRGQPRSGNYAYADYRFVPIILDPATTHDTALWRAWCLAQPRENPLSPDPSALPTHSVTPCANVEASREE